jgi:hypothetical protein
MNTTSKNLKNEPEALLSLEISERGIRRISIYADDDNLDQQTAAYALLAKVTPQLTLLQAALKAI